MTLTLFFAFNRLFNSMNNNNITKDDIIEILTISGYQKKSYEFFLKEFENCQIVIKILGNIYDMKIKSSNTFPTNDKDSISLNLQTSNPSRIDFMKIEANLLVLYQQFEDLLVEKNNF